MTVQELLALPRDPMLSNVAIEYRPDGFIADQVVDVVPVVLESAGYYVFDLTNFNIPEAKRNDKTVYKEIDFGLSSDTYRAEEYGLETRIGDRERRNAPGVVDLDVSKTRRLTYGILLNRERRIANLLTNTANVPQNTTLAGAAKWSDPTSTPSTVGATARATIRSQTGVEPNRLLLGYGVYQALRRHPEITDFFDGGRPTAADLAEFFEVGQVIVGGALYNTAKEGQAANLQDLWGNDALFYYQSSIRSADEPSFAYQFEAQALNVWRYRDVPVKSDVIGAGEIRAEKIVATALGYLVKAAI